jgi:uncharacterized protein with PIN domain
VIRVLDAHALMAYLEKEPGYEKVRDAFVEASENGAPLVMSVVNYGEVFYTILRECGPRVAEEIEKTIRALPIELIAVDLNAAREAGRFKAKYRISYADCFAAAMTRLRRAILMTGDPEFLDVEEEIKIEWLNKR